MAGLDRETLDATLSTLAEFAHRRLPDDKLLQLDAADEFPADVIAEMCGPDVGIQLFFVPEEYNGMGAGAVDLYRICEQLARIDLGVATGVLATFLGSDPISVGGTPEQKSEWMCRIADEGILFAYGATEPAAGSDLGALRSTATPVEENGVVTGYRLNGAKQWISNGGVAHAYTILANAPGGPSWFIVDRGVDGFSYGKPEDKHGIRASNTAALTLENVFVPADRLVGGVEGQGLAQAQAVFGYTRLMVAAFGLGAGWAALDRAIPYAKERIQAGGPLSEKQGYTHKLIVPHVVRLEAGRAYMELVAQRLDEGSDTLNTEGAIAKYLATEAGNAAADASIQALGGYGYTKEYMVEKIKRDVRITTIYEGTSEIMEMTISRDRWQQHLKSRGAHYHELAEALAARAAAAPECGGPTAALALHVLAEVMEKARLGRLTRNQHILFRIGSLVAQAEGAAALADRAAAAAAGTLHENADRRFPPDVLAAISRIYARETALTVALEGARWITAAAEDARGTSDPALRLDAIYAAQAGLLADMDRVADAVFERDGNPN